MRVVLKLGLVMALVLFPFVVTSPYYLHLLVVVAIFSIVALGLDIVFGYTGEVSLGHAALFGVGAYTAGVLEFQFAIGFWVALPLAVVVAAGFGALLALPALRVTGPYLAMVTLAFGTIIAILINEMTDLTNGPLGISLTKPFFADVRDLLPWLGMSRPRMRDVEYYYVVVACLLATLVVINRLLASRYGRAFEALRDSPVASDCMGVSVYAHKVLAFVRWAEAEDGPGDATVILANFADRAYDSYTIGLPAGGDWACRFNSDWRGYDGSFGDFDSLGMMAQGEPRDGYAWSGSTALAPYGVVILSR